MSLRDAFHYLAGLGFLALAKGRHRLKGYNPKPFTSNDLRKCADYDVSVVQMWLSHLNDYAEGSFSLSGKDVLELGPGSDLGVGLLLLAHGCARYHACDVNDLVRQTPDGLYDLLLLKLGESHTAAEIAALKDELARARAGSQSRLDYVVRDDFDLVAAFGEDAVDLVFSQAAFEHFDDVDATIAQLTRVCRPGAVIIATVDLKTHSRWICARDPNNIYRYPDRLYRLFGFRGIPNRVRPHAYREAFARHGWNDVRTVPLRLVPADRDAYAGLDRRFTDPRNQMEYLAVALCATKPWKSG